MPYDKLFHCTICDYLKILAMFCYYITLSLSLYVYIYIYILASSVICNYFVNTWLLCGTTCDYLLLSLALVDLHVFRTTVLSSTNAEQTVHDTVACKLTSQLVYLTFSYDILQTCQIWHRSFICLTMCIYL